MISNLDGAKTLFDLYQVEHGAYPDHLDANNCPRDSADAVDVKYCLNAGESYSYSSASTSAYLLKKTKDDISYMVDNDSSPVPTCPSGFISVPGSRTYGTFDFCVMKYEAKNAGGGVPISNANDPPWVSIDQSVAKVNAAKVANCTGCHLISEPEWMTIAQNVLKIPSNWSGLAVGDGYVFSGHSDNNPSTILSASLDDNLGYIGTGNSSGDVSLSDGMVGNSQRRTLTLDNGEVIWDFAGNVWEWIDARSLANKQPGLVSDTVYTWKHWNDSGLIMNGFASTSMPASTGVTNASNWSATQGIGRLWSNYAETTDRSYRRGGSYVNSIDKGAGVFGLNLNNNLAAANTGFRVSR